MNAGDIVAGRYRLLRPIGGGAMGTVWAARHEALGRDFALKLARVSTSTDPASRQRFQREAQLIGKLRHPNIVDVTDFGEASEAGDCFLVMELLEGESLAEHIEKRGPLDSYEAVTIAAAVARGLSAVHAVGIVHRDIKPENIFLSRSPTGDVIPKLLDFGISKEQTDSLATQHGALTGTPAYMSPEQANGETSVDARTDIWSLGVVLYEMITTKHPFVEPNYQALMTAIADRSYAPLDASVPKAVRELVARCLEKRPSARFASTEAFVRALDETLATLDTSTPRRSRKRALVIGGAVTIVLVIVASWAGLRSIDPPIALEASIASAPQHTATAPSSTAVPAAPTATATTSTIASPTSSTPLTNASSNKPARPTKRPTTNVVDPGF